MGWFWADSQQCPEHRLARRARAPQPSPTIEVSYDALTPRTEKSCPYSGSDAASKQPAPFTESPAARLNPLNRMPFDLSQSRAESQTVHLPVDRSVSSIPKGHEGEGGNWVYPSPQQMYNALLRKGYADTPQDAVEEMVAVHNFLNEGAWAEIVEWERRFNRGLSQGWRESQRSEVAAPSRRQDVDDGCQPRLLRFEGRPKDLTPKAIAVQLLGLVTPNAPEPPFDRHDWYIQRRGPERPPQEIRYVIDYYSAPPDPGGEAVFYLDVRPAVDSPRAAAERLLRWSGDMWYRASGAAARENKVP